MFPRGLPRLFVDRYPFDWLLASTWLREAGVDAETRGRLMGHSAGSVGERHYTAMTAAVMAKLRDAVETIRLDRMRCTKRRYGAPKRQGASSRA